MANIDNRRGFVPRRYRDGSAWNGATNIYVVLAADANQISPGDAVKSFAGGDANGIPAVTKALGTDTVRGVVVGVMAAAPNAPSLVGTTLDLTLQNIPAAKTKDYYVMVVDDPAVVFELQDDGITALTATSLSKNASFTVVNPTAPNQNSQSVLTTASVAVTLGLPLKIVGIVPLPNNALGPFCGYLVVFNQHELGGTGTVGI